MDGDFTNLRCFQHCSKDLHLICFRLPEICPICHQCTATTESRVPPFVLPSPFTASSRSPCSVIIKPTNGDFIKNYVRTSDLHIGITDKQGYVYDFDEHGLNQGSMWPECLAVLTHPVKDWSSWERTLIQVTSSGPWEKERYHEHNWNCFDFVLYFLQLLEDTGTMSEMPLSKTEFCDNFLVQKTKRVEQFIHLYRQALQQGCVAIPKGQL